MIVETFKKFYDRYVELNMLLSKPETANSLNKFVEYSKELSQVSKKAQLYKRYVDARREIEELESIVTPEIEEEIRKEIEEKEKEIKNLDEEAEKILNSSNPDFDRNVIVEIRAGVGGQESALFAGELFRMYVHYAERHSLKVEVLYSHGTELNGFKEISFLISGQNAYNLFKYESGVHRVQRVPVTEASGRIHTSTATVAVLPEASEVELEIKPDELKIDTFRSSGAGGQHVNRTESAVRITHLPSGIMVVCESERSQIQNRAIAMKILRSKLLKIKREEEEKKFSSMRRNQIGSGERSEKIRTYNFPQNRVSDHRSGFTTYKLERVLNGELDEIVESLKKWEIENGVSWS